MTELADRFMQALQQLERQRDVEVIAPLFSDKAELRRAPRKRTYLGAAEMRRFWSEYLDAFQYVETKFREVTKTEGRAVLEWHSVATTKQGRHIEYDGCSVIEGEGDQVDRFRTYYDAAAAGMGASIAAVGTGIEGPPPAP